jgi:hypothetical protein
MPQLRRNWATVARPDVRRDAAAGCRLLSNHAVRLVRQECPTYFLGLSRTGIPACLAEPRSPMRNACCRLLSGHAVRLVRQECPTYCWG